MNKMSGLNWLFMRKGVVSAQKVNKLFKTKRFGKNVYENADRDK